MRTRGGVFGGQPGKNTICGFAGKVGKLAGFDSTCKINLYRQSTGQKRLNPRKNPGKQENKQTKGVKNGKQKTICIFS